MELQYVNNSFPYNSAGSFVNFFEGLAYEHVNFIFADAIYSQESMYSNVQASPYKFGLSDPNSYYDYNNTHMVNDHSSAILHDYSRHFENPRTISSQHTAPQWNGNNASADTNNNNIDCVFSGPRVYLNANNNQVIWQDDVDPDNMTYEELLELGETVGTQNRGLTPDQISLLPVKKFKGRGFFFRKKSKTERCVICQMEYKRGNRQMILPCKHAYHVDCGTKWLSINKACPICYTEVSIENNKTKH
ncbi:E3 ubiquitin-protein ligase BIG BROTHER-like [Impatiens glandulifera]|uniref:E3 ubiquitin-protein ligase BIG BROTHER-like n=1 Tax=Impatiens glandulifera TaxID=253017 RepID=UPI001FB062C0|nr:E3 ubiquitin-protein ligase BIG BROTHER-like [Impatiens glandulifera]